MTRLYSNVISKWEIGLGFFPIHVISKWEIGLGFFPIHVISKWEIGLGFFPISSSALSIHSSNCFWCQMPLMYVYFEVTNIWFAHIFSEYLFMWGWLWWGSWDYIQPSKSFSRWVTWSSTGNLYCLPSLTTSLLPCNPPFPHHFALAQFGESRYMSHSVTLQNGQKYGAFGLWSSYPIKTAVNKPPLVVLHVVLHVAATPKFLP